MDPATDEAAELDKALERLSLYQPTREDDDTVEFLRIVSKHIPAAGRANLDEDMAACETDDDLRRLAASIDTGLLRPMKAFGNENAGNEIFIEDEDEDGPARVLRRQVRARDGHKCVISGLYDYNYRDQMPAGGLDAVVETAHLVPFGIIESLRSDDDRKHAAAIWAIVHRYFPGVRESLEFLEDEMNSPLMNVMTLEMCLHTEFRRFLMTFESMDVEHRYRVKPLPGFAGYCNRFLPSDGIVSFCSHDDGKSHLPSPELLALHAAVADILHATGRGKIIDGIVDEYWRFSRLAGDGSTDVGRLLSVSELSLLAQSDFVGERKQPHKIFR